MYSLYKVHWSCPYAIKKQWKARNFVPKPLWVPWAVSLWHKRSAMISTNKSPAWTKLDQWEWSTLPATNNTLSRRSVAKVLGEFSLKEHLFYAGIFFSMSLIVIFCFLLVNRDNSSSSSSSLSSAQLSYYDGGKRPETKLHVESIFAQIVCKLSNDKTISFISIRRICCDQWLFVKFLNVWLFTFQMMFVPAYQIPTMVGSIWQVSNLLQSDFHNFYIFFVFPTQ